MKRILILLLFVLPALTFGQFRIVGTGLFTTLNDSTYRARVEFRPDLTGNSYNGNQLDTSMLVLSQAGQLYRLDSFFAATSASAWLILVEEGGNWGSPRGQIMVFQTPGKYAAPQAVYAANGATAAMQAGVDTWNAKLLRQIADSTFLWTESYLNMVDSISFANDSLSTLYLFQRDGDTLSAPLFPIMEASFDTSTVLPARRHLRWSNDDATLLLGAGFDGVVHRIGQELFYPNVINKTASTIIHGTVVMVDPVQLTTGDHIRVVPADGSGIYPSKLIMGVMTQDLPVDSLGFVTWFGYVRNVKESNIAETAITFSQGDILYLSAIEPGKLTNIEPSPPAVKIPMAVVVRRPNANNITLLVRPWLNEDLGELNDVKIDSVVQGQILRYDTIGGYWVASTTAGIVAGDTAAMLSTYINREDTATMLTNYVNFEDTLTTIGTKANLALKLNAADTASLSNRINLKLNAADTVKYVKYVDTLTTIGTKANLALKLNAADTASLSNRINLKVSISDTASMLSTYLRPSEILAGTGITLVKDSTVTISAPTTLSSSTAIIDIAEVFVDNLTALRLPWDGAAVVGIIKTGLYLTSGVNEAFVQHELIPNGDKGDITTSAGGAVMTIDAGAVTNSKANFTTLTAQADTAAQLLGVTTDGRPNTIGLAGGLTLTNGFLTVTGLAGGTVTSVQGGNGIITDPAGGITAAGTVSADTSVLASKVWANNALALKLNAADTASLSSRIDTKLNAADTASLSTRIDAKQNTITGAATSITTANLTASRALVSDSGGKVAASAVTATELGYLSGVTSSIQTQLNGKQNTLTNPITGTGTANQIAFFSGTTSLSSLTTATYPNLTELSYVKGVTSAIQTQLNTKLNAADTASLSSRIDARVLYTDTTSLIATKKDIQPSVTINTTSSTVTMTSTSSTVQICRTSGSCTYRMPATSGLTVGRYFEFKNETSFDIVSVITNTSNTLLTLFPGQSGRVMVISTANDNAESFFVNTPFALPVVYEYTSAITDELLSIPKGCKTIEIVCIGGGGGGGSGRRGVASGQTIANGGNGGTSGAYSFISLDASAITAQLKITVGAGGTGGSARTTNDTDGANGTNGGASSVYTGATGSPANALLIYAGGGGYGGGGSSPGFGTDTVGGKFFGDFPGNGGGLGNGTDGTNIAAGVATTKTPTGGGGGGNITASTTENNGGNGGAAGYGRITTTNRGTTTTPNATAGYTPVAGQTFGGGGGGGGASKASGAAGNGGAGVRGGGGGGGGASVNGVNSGAGGNGGTGYVRITFY